MLHLVLLLALALPVVACGGPNSGTPANTVDIQGTVEFSSIEGGWWFLRADSGETYTPTNLSSEFKVPGIRVRATLVVQPDVVGFVPGPFVVIDRIERLPAASGG